jgi:hypothetical protein
LHEINGFDFALSLRRTNSRQLSKVTSIPESVVSQIRRGRRPPSPSERKAILKALDLPETIVFAGPDFVRELLTKLDDSLRLEIGARMFDGQRQELATPLARR